VILSGKASFLWSILVIGIFTALICVFLFAWENREIVNMQTFRAS